MAPRAFPSAKISVLFPSMISAGFQRRRCWLLNDPGPEYFVMIGELSFFLLGDPRSLFLFFLVRCVGITYPSIKVRRSLRIEGNGAYDWLDKGF